LKEKSYIISIFKENLADETSQKAIKNGKGENEMKSFYIYPFTSHNSTGVWRLIKEYFQRKDTLKNERVEAKKAQEAHT
jgi:hypothetical protein